MGLDKAHINSIPLRILQGEGGQDTLVVVQIFTFLGNHTQVTTLETVYTASPPVGAVRMLVQAFGQHVRFTLDGTTPTASLGFQLRKDTPPIIVPIKEGTPPKFIEELDGATIEIQYGY